MLLRSSFKNGWVLRQVGLSCLVVAGLVNLFWHPAPGAGARAVDAAKGFLYGIAIATLFVSLLKQRQAR